jgi:hypothetical protein
MKRIVTDRATVKPYSATSLTRLSLLLFLVVFLMPPQVARAQGQLAVSPTSYSITYEIGGPLPAQQPGISVTSSAAPLSFTASTSGEPWLTINPLSGTTPSSISVTISVTGLTVGKYSSTITISSPGQPFVTVPVTLSITEPTRPTLWAVPGSLSFNYQMGLNPPAPQALSLTSYPPGQTITATASGGTWLSVNTAGKTTPTTALVAVHPAGLVSGTYQGKITVTSSTAGASPITVPVTLVVSIPQSISFLFQISSPPPAQVCFMLTSASSGANFSASASTASGDNWLAVTPAAGVTPANVCISSAPQGLPLGNYSGTVTITGATATPLTISVTLAVANGPLLSVNPTLLSFMLEAGGSPPSAQSVSVTSDVPSSGVPLAASASTATGGNWLAVSPAQSSTPGTFAVSIKPVTLVPGVYTGSVVITSSTASNSPVTIPVTLTVPDIRLSALPALLAFNYQIGCNAPGPLSLALSSNAVDGSPFPVGFTATANSAGGNGAWLSIDSQAGSTPGNINVSVNTNGISAGTYTGTVTVASATAANGPQAVPVLLIANSPGLSLNPGSLTFNYQMGSAGLSPSPLAITSCGAPLDFEMSVPPVGWLSIDTPSGSTPAAANLSVNPGNLSKGTYQTSITISSVAAGSSQNVPVTLVVRDGPTIIARPSALSFYYEQGFPGPAPQILSVSAGNTNIAATATTAFGGSWLSINNTGGTTPTNVSVAVLPGSLAPGTYTGTISIGSVGASNSSANILVTLTVAKAGHLAASPASLSFEAQVGAPISKGQTITVSSTGSQLGFATSFTGGGWLSVNPTPHDTTGTVNGATGQVASAPALVSALANTIGLAAGIYSGTITITPDSGAAATKIPVTLTIRDNHLRIPQVADGNGWMTTIVLVNTDSDPAPYTLSFRNAYGSPVALPLQGIGTVSNYSDVIPVGGSRTIVTQGTSSNLIQGWGEVVAAKSINGTAIFRQHAAGSVDTEGAVPLKSSSGNHFLVPFDNTQGFVTAMAMLNPDSAQTATVNIVFRDEDGQQISTGSLVLGPGTRQAFVLPSQFYGLANERGVAEFTSTVEISALGLRASPRYTLASIEPIDTASLPAAGTTATISQIADGGGWETTMILVNTGSAPAPVSVRFTQPYGTPWALQIAGTDGVSEYSDVIPVGGSRILDTAGYSPVLSQGWGQVITTGSVEGTAIFRQRLSIVRDAEGAVPLSLSGMQQFVLPFDNTQGFATAIALANEDPSQSTAVSVTLRDLNGVLLGNGTVNLAPLGRSAFVVPTQFPMTGNVQGVAEFSSSNVTLSALGLRYNPIGSFTSIPAAQE